jgi:hypothetical protein
MMMGTLRSLMNVLKTGLHHQEACPEGIKREQQLLIQFKELVLHTKVET